MQTAFIHPAQALSSWLVSGLDQCNQALFTVAYLSEEGIEILVEALRKRLKRKTALVRILFQDHGFRTDPAAIRALQEVAKSKPGTLKLRFAGPELLRLHAKAYGFKQGKDHLEVILGSSNVGGKALGTDSGELNVRLAGRVATEAWSAMEEYWDAGYAVTARWLERYAKAHAKHKRAAAKAESIAKGWRGARPRTVKAADPWKDGVYVVHDAPMSTAEYKAVKKRVKETRAHGVDVPEGYVTYGSKKLAQAIARQGRVLEVFWRSHDDDNRGLKYLRFVNCGRAIRVGNKQIGVNWVLQMKAVRGTTVHLKPEHLAAVEKALVKSSFEYGTLDKLSGRLVKRAKTMKAIYTALRKIAAKPSKKAANHG